MNTKKINKKSRKINKKSRKLTLTKRSKTINRRRVMRRGKTLKSLRRKYGRRYTGGAPPKFSAVPFKSLGDSSNPRAAAFKIQLASALNQQEMNSMFGGTTGIVIPQFPEVIPQAYTASAGALFGNKTLANGKAQSVGDSFALSRS
jgi:hypothetical protein